MIIDTGIHKYGWTSANAIKFLTENTAFSATAAKNEVTRYVSVPGQATSYKVGEREIRRLRKKFTDYGFDLKKFHSAVLHCEGPIYGLESCIDIYMERNRPKVTK